MSVWLSLYSDGIVFTGVAAEFYPWHPGLGLPMRGVQHLFAVTGCGSRSRSIIRPWQPGSGPTSAMDTEGVAENGPEEEETSIDGCTVRKGRGEQKLVEFLS